MWHLAVILEFFQFDSAFFSRPRDVMLSFGSEVSIALGFIGGHGIENPFFSADCCLATIIAQKSEQYQLFGLP